MTSASTFAWYLRRASAMSPPELVHRLREQWRRNLSRLDRRGWDQFDIGDGPLMPLRALRPFAGPWPAGMEEATRRQTTDPEVSFLGEDWPTRTRTGGDPGVWHDDPVTGRPWPAADTYCFDVKWRNVADKSDVKFVLELNRFQHLHAVAALAMRDSDAAASLGAAEELLAWMEENPPFRGLNWLSGIELALRLVSAAFVVSALDAACPGHPHRRALRAFVAAHAYWLDRFPSLYSSANNHLVSEGLGLLIAAKIVPDLPRARRCRRHGRAILAKAALTQFHDDGTGVEQSPTYAAFTLEMLLLGILVERECGREPSLEAQDSLVRATQHLRAMLDSGGNNPRIGDDDEGRVVATPPVREDRYVASVVAASAGMLDRPDLAPPVRAEHLRDVLFAPPACPAPSPVGVLHFPSGGYTIVRERLAGRDMLLVMDHGPLGFDPLAAHGHADALSVWLHIDDQPVLVDAGTYRYNSSGAWRDWMRSTSAHNTLAVCGKSQSLTSGAFNWRHKAKAELHCLDASAEWRMAARHDGYVGRFGVVHERSCCRVGDGVLVEDIISPARDGIEVTIGFLVHPALTVRRHRDGVVISRGNDALVRLTSGSSAPVIVTEPRRAGGPPAYSGAYNSLEPASRIEFHPERLDEPHGTLIEILAQEKAGTATTRSRMAEVT